MGAAVGSLTDAIADLRGALTLLSATNASRSRTRVVVMLAGALADQQRFEEADQVLAGLAGIDDPGFGLIGLPIVVARVQLGLGRPDAALVQIERQLEFQRQRGWRLSAREAIDAVHVSALAATGRRDEAHEVARSHVDLAVARGVAGHEARARLALAGVLQDREALEQLQRAVEAGRRSPLRLVLAQALAALGAAQRRANHRTVARETLRDARELAHRCGASGLEASIHEELLVAGARPQRIALAGVDSLTAAERRVAELAAQGLRNREIAEALFVSLKTVEVHLGRSYSKLDIRSRAQLPAALHGGASTAAGASRRGSGPHRAAGLHRSATQ